MAMRLLLTLLALLTGLAAQLSPAQARGVGPSEVSVEIARSDVLVVTSGARTATAVPAFFGKSVDRQAPSAQLGVRVTAVILQADRAHE